jgi:hypothetical protein
MLTSDDFAFMQEALAEIAPATEQTIIYRHYDHTEPGDEALGIPPQDVYIDEETTAAVRELTVEEIQVSAGAFTIGDLEFTVRRESVDARDRIVYNGMTWKPVELRRMYLGGTLGWKLRCRKE